ncbi:MAG: AzlD domain-containing protein [Clostridiales bacterium]|nr:AzlD domain-containing protein [Clostridiales bacterium]
MSGNPYIYILVMAGVTYLIRMLPLTLIRRPITSRFIKSFLYYVPYVTLSVMTFPAILTGTASPWSGLGAFVTAIALSCLNRGLIFTSLAASASVFILELIIL